MTRLAWDSVLAWRLERQHLAARAPRDAALAVVSDVAGLHAQVASCAELTLWARVEGLEPGAVSALLWEERALVKTWAMRGTLHLLASAELPRFVAALSRLRPRHHVPAWLRAHGLEREQAEAMLAAIAAALDGAELTRAELAEAVAARVGEPALAGPPQGRLRRPAQARRVHRRPLLRARRRPARALHAPGRLAGRLGSPRRPSRPRTPSSAPTCAPTVRHRASSSSAGSA